MAVGATGCRQILGFEEPQDPEPLGPWQPARRVDALSEAMAGDLMPALRSDGLEVYFTTTRTDNIDDIWRSTRATTSDAWSAPAAVTRLNMPSPVNELLPKLSPDGLTMYLSRGTSAFDIYVSTRASVDSVEWSDPTAVPALSSVHDDYAGNTDATNTHMVFSSDRAIAGEIDMYEIVRDNEAEPWNAAQIRDLASVNLVGRNEYAGHLTEDGRTLYFYSDRSGQGYELYVTSRPNIDASFGDPTLIVELQSALADTVPTVTADQRYLMFSRGTVSENATTYDLYEASR